MKKVFIILFITVVSVWLTKHLSFYNDAVNLLELSNIEALADDERLEPGKCIGSGSVDCPVFHTKVEVVYSGYSVEKLFE